MPSLQIPPMKDLKAANITDNVNIVNSQCPNRRFAFVLNRLVTHLHAFAREISLSTEEWEAGLAFLVAMILLSDTLGLSALVDSINHPQSGRFTEGTVLGPFHTDDAPGFYDIQNPHRSGPDGRAVLHSNEEGMFFFRGLVPVSYSIPGDGPVGAMLQLLNRHPNRPGHVHFMLQKDGYDRLVTALYPRGDPYEASDPVFGVKGSLIVDLGSVDEDVGAKYGVAVGTKLLTYAFVLATVDEASRIREKNARS
ncbi:Intradiol ring-cleavage dioxygenase [Aspergillus californicus]